MKTKSTRSNKIKTKGMNKKNTKRRGIKQNGGFISTMGFGFNGNGNGNGNGNVNGNGNGNNNSFFSKTSGTKKYDPDLRRMRNQLCYDIFGLKFCRFDPDDINQPQQQQGQQGQQQQSKSWFSSWFGSIFS